MNLNLDAIKKCFALVEHVDFNPGFASSQFIRLRQENGMLTFSLSGILWAEASMKSDPNGGKWTFYVGRQTLGAFLNTMAGETIELGVNKDKVLLIRGKGQHLDLPNQAPAVTGYGSWAPTSTTSIESHHHAALELLAGYCPKTSGMEHLGAVNLIKDWGIVATDTLFIAALLQAPKQNLLLPASLATMLVKLSDGSSKIKVASDKNGVGIPLAGGWLFHPLMSEASKYPTSMVKSMIAAASVVKLTTNFHATRLLGALTAAAAFAQDTEVATVTINENKATLVVKVGGGKYERTLPTKGNLLVKDIAWPVARLVKWVAYIAAIQEDATIVFGKLEKASVLQATVASGQKHMLVFADY